MTTSTAPKPQPFTAHPYRDDQRADYAAGLRHLADLIEAGLAAALPHTGLYARTGFVTVHGHDFHCTVYCAQPLDRPALPAPEAPAGDGPVPTVPGGSPVYVDSLRVDR